MGENIPIMLKLEEASKMSGLSYDALRKLCLQNRIVHIRVGRKYFVNWNKLQDFLEQGDDNV